jgi:hypothetical protein
MLLRQDLNVEMIDKLDQVFESSVADAISFMCTARRLYFIV